MTKPTDSYPLERSAMEFRRLRVQAESLAAETAVMLDRIPIAPGWSCLDLGCGVGGIGDLLSARVGPGGRVVGLDIDAGSLAAARRWAAQAGLDNAEFVRGDIFALDLPHESFDFVHVRYVMTTVGRHDAVLVAGLSTLKPGGVLALQEADGDGLSIYPEHPAWDRLKAVLIELFRHIGADPYAGRQVYRMLLEAGLEDVGFRPCQAGARSTDPLASYMPETIASVRSAILEYRLMPAAELDDAVAQCKAHLGQPTTTSTSVIVIQAWGRKPGR